MAFVIHTASRGPRMAGGPQPVTIETRYDSALRLANDVLVAWQDFKFKGKAEEQKQILNSEISELIEFLLDQYSGLDMSNLESNDIVMKGIHSVFSEGPDRLTLDSLHMIPEALVPVVVMREILNTHRVIFSPKSVHNWKDFVGLYGKYILAA